MKAERTTSVLVVRAAVPVAIIAVGVASFWALSTLLRQELSHDSGNEKPPTARVALVRRHNEGLTIHADGVVVPYREVEVSTQVAGRIIQRAAVCRAGRYVEAGELLVQIDPQDYQLEVDRSAEQLEQAQVALEEWQEQIQGTARLMKYAERELELRTSELNRLRAAERTAFSLTDLERAEAAKLAAENALESLRNKQLLLQVGQSRLQSAQELAEVMHRQALLDLERTSIVAPLAGVVVSDFVEEDSFVQVGTCLAVLEDTSKVEVKCKLEMDDLYWLWDQASEDGAPPAASAAQPTAPPGRGSLADGEAYDLPEVPVQVVYELAGGGREFAWQGRLERYDGSGLDERTRTVPCRVVVDHPRQRSPADRSGPPALMRGMYVSLRIRVVPRTPLLQIPESALRPGNVVWRVRDGELAIVPVRFVSVQSPPDAGHATGGQRHVLIHLVGQDDQDPASLLTAGDQVVTSPLVFVQTGMQVSIAPPDGELAP